MSGTRLLTFNLWWKDHFQEERLHAVRALVEKLEPEMIAFQEVSVNIVGLLLKLFEDYKPWPRRIRFGGLMILSKQDWVERGELRLTSAMGRELVWCRTHELTLATVHLESTAKQTQARIDQLAEVFRFLEPYSPVVLMGDFNFAPDWPENHYLNPEYRDAWSVLHPDLPGYTEDTSVNLMRMLDSGKEKQVRFDRVFCKGAVRPHFISLVGTEALESNPMVWPSDHFGLLCDVQLGGPAPVKHAEKLVMLGASQSDYGSFLSRERGKAVACLSVGSDPESPSMSYKADSEQPNEDALLVIKDGSTYLFAVADGHFGNHASHALIKRLSEEPLAKTPEQLLQVAMRIQEPEMMHGSGSTFLAAVLDTQSGEGFGVSAGDGSLVTISGRDLTHRAPHNSRFFYFNRPLNSEEWEQFRFRLEPGELLLLFSDGVNECHYRCPETSIQDSHIMELWDHLGPDVKKFVRTLTQLALQGVAGNPGGQDNIAVIGFSM